jgi:hypothetical protein
MNTLLTILNSIYFIDLDILLGATIFSPDIVKKIIAGLKAEIENAQTAEEKESLIKEIDSYVRGLKADFKQHKAELAREEKLKEKRAKRAKTMAERKAAFANFIESDLYSVACFILGFDIKQKIKSLALNSKWIKTLNPPTVDPASFSMNHFTFDIEAYKNEAGDFIPFQFGLYNSELG